MNERRTSVIDGLGSRVRAFLKRHRVLTGVFGAIAAAAIILSIILILIRPGEHPSVVVQQNQVPTETTGAIQPDLIDLGALDPGNEIVRTVQVRNTSSQRLTIRDVATDCACLVHSIRVAIRSPHIGGANFAFADGSVRFISYSANNLLAALATRAGGESVVPPD